MSGALVLVLQHKDINASLFVERLKVKLTSALCFLPYRGLKGFKIGDINEEEGVRRGVHKVRWLTYAMGERGACCADRLFGRADSVLLAFCLWRLCGLMWVAVNI
jgi:hypothetical protein